MSFSEYFSYIVDFLSIDLTVLGVTFSFFDIFAWILFVDIFVFAILALFDFLG